MEFGALLAIGLAIAFALTNGFHDASNAIATLVATRGATPGQAVVLSSIFNMAGALLLGTAVANTVGKIVSNPTIAVIGAALAGAVVWNLVTWWKGLPSSSGHALVGGLVGAGLWAGFVGGETSVYWGGFDGWHPTGVIGTLVALFISPPLGFLGGLLLVRFLRLVSRRWTARWVGPVNGGGWVAAAGLSYSHGGNDAQKAMGIIGVLIVLGQGEAVTGNIEVPFWVKFVTGLALTLGTALGGWRIVKTIGRKIFGLTPIDSFSSQSSSTAVILGASLMGAPVSTTQIVASSVVGIGVGRRRWRHVRWEIVREMGIAWLTTIPAAAALAVVFYLLWTFVEGLFT